MSPQGKRHRELDSPSNFFPLDTPGMYSHWWPLWLLRSGQPHMHHILTTLCSTRISPLDTLGMYSHSWLLMLLRSGLADMHHIMSRLCRVHIFLLDKHRMCSHWWLPSLLRSGQPHMHHILTKPCWLRTSLGHTQRTLTRLCCFHIFQQGMTDTH